LPFFILCHLNVDCRIEVQAATPGQVEDANERVGQLFAEFFFSLSL